METRAPNLVRSRHARVERFICKYSYFSTKINTYTPTCTIRNFSASRRKSLEKLQQWCNRLQRTLLAFNVCTIAHIADGAIAVGPSAAVSGSTMRHCRSSRRGDLLWPSVAFCPSASGRVEYHYI